MGLGLPVRLIRPQEWQRGIRRVADTKDAARKRALRDEATRIFPNVKLTLKTADAALIADYGRRHNT